MGQKPEVVDLMLDAIKGEVANEDNDNANEQFEQVQKSTKALLIASKGRNSSFSSF